MDWSSTITKGTECDEEMYILESSIDTPMETQNLRRFAGDR